MKRFLQMFLFAVLTLLAAVPLHAATYSWVDGQGVHHYTDDYTKVPEAYRHKVKQRDDVRQDAPREVPPQTVPQAGENGVAATPAAVGGDGTELFGGKSSAAWRAEMAVLEAELVAIEQRTAQMRKQLAEAKGMSSGQFEALKKEYGESRERYDLKYKSYAELIEAVRKAGIIVEIKK